MEKENTIKSRRSYGLDLTREKLEQDGTEYLAGSVSCIAEIPETEREKYLPKGEIQKSKYSDMQDCATRAPLNILECKLNFLIKNNLLPEETKKWLEDKDYILPDGIIELSDAYIAILSGTTEQGNSLKAPLQAIHEFGVIPKHLLPLKSDMTFKEYHNPERITESMKRLGQEFIERLKINYTKEYDFKNFMKIDMLDTAGYAWPVHVDGIYPRVEYTFNHAFVVWKTLYKAFDNYPDSFDGDFIKNLAPDYKFLDYGYRLTINIGEIKKKEQLTIMQNILNLIQKVISTIMNEPKPMPEVKPELVQPPEVKPEPPKYDWSNSTAVRHSVRLICDEEGLSWDMKNRLTETVKGESGFNPKAININRDKTKDCGIAQLNERWYLKSNNMTCQEAIDDPEKSVRIMARAFKQGRARDWIAYRKLYLNKLGSMNYSTTQLGNIIKLISGILVLFGAKPFSDDETNAIIVVIGLVGELIGFVISWIGRFNAGGVTFGGFKKNTGEIDAF